MSGQSSSQIVKGQRTSKRVACVTTARVTYGTYLLAANWAKYNTSGSITKSKVAYKWSNHIVTHGRVESMRGHHVATSHWPILA
jgi:hypothetical protein